MVSARPAPIQSSAGCRLTLVNGTTTTVPAGCAPAGSAAAMKPEQTVARPSANGPTRAERRAVLPVHGAGRRTGERSVSDMAGA